MVEPPSGGELAASLCLLGAGAVHLQVAGAHGAGSAAFTIAGVAQLGVAVLILLPRRRRMRPIATGVTAGLVTLLPLVAWAWTRVAPLPLVHEHAEPIGAPDGLAVGLELIALAGVLGGQGWLERGTRLPRMRPVHGAVIGTVGLVAALGLLLAASPGEAGPTHDHDETTAVAHGVDHDGEECPEGEIASDPPVDAQQHAGRLPTHAAAALDALVARSIDLPCGTIAAHGHGGHGSEERDLFDQPVTRTEAEQRRLTEQWNVAVASVEGLDTIEEARRAGYLKSAAEVPGVGSHWIDWTLVDRPFDPATPSMLLFHAWPGQEQRLVGFSYWARSSGGPPDGFAGPEDTWHRHLGLCFDDGWLQADGVPSAAQCAGQWISGHDLWMLHAWVVPGEESPLGRFAARNPLLCPGDRAQVPDIMKCNQP